MHPAARFAPYSRLLSAALAGILIFALALAGFSSAAEGKVKVKVQTSTQKAMLKAGGLKVLVTSNKRARVTVSATGKGKSGYFRKVKTTVKGRRSVTLPLTDRGFGALGYCRAVPVTAKAGTSRASRKLKAGGCVNLNLGQNPARCDFLDPTECLQPFANDYFTRSDRTSETGKRLDLWRDGMPASITEGGGVINRTPLDPTDMNRGDGFSPGNLITLKIPGLDTPQAFENSDIVPITDPGAYADPNQPVIVLDTATGERHPIWAEIDSNPTAVDPTEGNPGGINEDPGNTEGVNLIIRPARNFEHGRRYVVILRNLKNAADQKIAAPKAFQVYRDRRGTRYSAVENRRPRMESIIRTATNRGNVKRSSLYMAWDFTVASAESVTGRALEIRDDAFERLGDTDLANRTIEGDAPEFVIDSTSDNPATGIQRRVEGTITVPCYLNSNNCAPGGVFEFDQDDELTWEPGKTASFPFRCDIPNTASAGNPAKTLTYGHGLLGSRTQVSSGYQRALAPLSNTVQCAVDWVGFADGDSGSVLAALADMSNFPLLVDRMQQGFVNFLYLQRALIHEEGFASSPAFQNGSGTSLIDLSEGTATRGQYMGISQGGIMGGALTALSPDVDYGVLGVPGMNYSTLLRRSVDSDDYFKNPTIGLYKYYPDFGNRMLLLSLVQLLWDRGEANGYAHFMTDEPLPNTPPHEVLMRVAFSDHQVANVTAEVQARTIGAKAYAPALQEGRHWAVDPYFGLEQVTDFPFQGGSMMVYYDSGPNTFTGKRGVGVAPPPNENLPPRSEWDYGRDPHGDPREAMAGMTHAIEFLNGPDLDGVNRGTVRSCLDITGLDGDLAPDLAPRIAGDNHCYANGWNGLPGLPG